MGTAMRVLAADEAGGEWVLRRSSFCIFSLQPLASSLERAAGSCLSFLFHAFDKENLFIIVDFAELYFNDLAAAGRNMLADVGGFNG